MTGESDKRKRERIESVAQCSRVEHLDEIGMCLFVYFASLLLACLRASACAARGHEAWDQLRSAVCSVVLADAEERLNEGSSSSGSEGNELEINESEKEGLRQAHT